MDVTAIYSLPQSPRKADEKLTKTDSLVSSWSSLLGVCVCVCVCQVFISRQRTGADVSPRWEAWEMLSGVYWKPPTVMDGHINSGVGQRFHLWWQPESGLLILLISWRKEPDVAGAKNPNQHWAGWRLWMLEKTMRTETDSHGTRGGGRCVLAEEWRQNRHEINVYGQEQRNGGEILMRRKEKQRVQSSRMFFPLKKDKNSAEECTFLTEMCITYIHVFNSEEWIPNHPKGK